jgi:hypothetical protein
MKRRNEMNEAEKRMYGMSQEDIRTYYMESITAEVSGLEMVVAGILSDCQEMMAAGVRIENGSPVVSPLAVEQVRKQMNIAKFILFEMMDQNDVRKQYAKRKKEIAKDKRYGGFTV